MRAVIAGIVAVHAPWTLTLAGLGRWPDALYATVEPDAPVRALQAELAAEFRGSRSTVSPDCGSSPM